MSYNNLKSISPLDGRYSEKVSELRDIFSEYGLIKYRVFIEIKWLQHLSSINDLKELPEFNSNLDKKLNSILNSFNIDQANEIKKIESVTNHDVKAIEYYLRDSLKDYDGFEGIILFLILTILVKNNFLERKGFISALFLVFYSTFRFVIEFFREPDLQIGYLLFNLTLGQILCLIFFSIGFFLLKKNERL